MKKGINKKLLLALAWDIGMFLSAVFVFVLKPSPLKSLLVVAPIGMLFVMNELSETPADVGSDLTHGERKWRLCVDLAGFSLLAALIIFRALRKDDADAWHWASFELIILGAMLWLVFSESPPWRFRKEKPSSR